MNIKGHFETITRHKLLVMKYCFECGLYRQGLTHDLSVRPHRSDSFRYFFHGDVRGR